MRRMEYLSRVFSQRKLWFSFESACSQPLSRPGLAMTITVVHTVGHFAFWLIQFFVTRSNSEFQKRRGYLRFLSTADLGFWNRRTWATMRAVGSNRGKGQSFSPGTCYSIKGRNKRGRFVEGNNTSVVFFIVGSITLAIGFLAWHFPLVSIPFAFVGIYWLATGFALKYVGRNVPDSAFMLALVFGVVGVIYALHVEEPGWSLRNRVEDISTVVPYNYHNVRKRTGNSPS